MIKMMLMLLVSEGIENQKWTLETPIRVSARAASTGGSQVYLKEGEIWSLNQLMKAVSIVSANDAAVAVAEGLWGSVESYLKEANQRAKEIGMNETRINSVHGLPPGPGEEYDRTTARDMATLARWCVTKPLILEWTKQQELQFRPEESIRYNTNKLLWRMKECDGLKTGYTQTAGFCITATAVRDGIRLIAVVMGEKNLMERISTAQTLLENVFSETKRVPYLAKGNPVSPDVRISNSPVARVTLVSAKDVSIPLREKDKNRLNLVLNTPERLRAPLRPGDTVATAFVTLDGYTLAHIPLTVNQEIPTGNWRWKTAKAVLKRTN